MKGAQLGRIIRLLEEGEQNAEVRKRWVDSLFIPMSIAMDPLASMEHFRAGYEEERERIRRRRRRFIR